MDIGDDECHWCGTPVFDPVHSRPEFGEYLAGTLVVLMLSGGQAPDRGAGYYAVLTLGLVATVAVTILVTRIAHRALGEAAA